MRWRPIFRAEDKFDALPEADARRRRHAPSSPCRKAATSSAPSASCPTRAAANIRGPSRRSTTRRGAWSSGACARSRCSARTSTPIAAKGRTARHGRSRSCSARLARIEGLARLRYTTSHPRDMGDDLIAAHGDLPKLMPYLHLPVQSGSDAVLEAMNRQHTRRRLSPHRRARARARGPTSRCRPISSSASPARATRISRRRWRWCATSATRRPISFKYSPRPGTPAVGRAQADSGRREGRRGCRRLQALAARAAAKRSTQSCAGRTLAVLFEKPGRQAGPGDRPQPLSAARPCRGCGAI